MMCWDESENGTRVKQNREDVSDNITTVCPFKKFTMTGTMMMVMVDGICM